MVEFSTNIHCRDYLRFTILIASMAFVVLCGCHFIHDITEVIGFMERKEDNLLLLPLLQCSLQGNDIIVAMIHAKLCFLILFYDLFVLDQVYYCLFHLRSLKSSFNFHFFQVQNHYKKVNNNIF